ncbi:15208_t:CDS:1, partial [Funneliformis mosseae]
MINKSSNKNSKLTLRPPFPPTLTAHDLLPSEKSINRSENVRIPNAFIAYRMALVRELKLKNVASHRSNVSTYASRLWAEESDHVKDVYKKMANDATMLYNKARGITFLSYERSGSSDKSKKTERERYSVNVNEPLKQDIEEETTPQQDDLTPPPPAFDQSYLNNLSMVNQQTFYSVRSGAFDHNVAHSVGANPFGQFFGNFSGRLSVEHRLQALEQQMALFHQ